MNDEMEEWLSTRPRIIQDLARKYPPGEYKISEDAPYGITCPGTIVYLVAYYENGLIRVAVEPHNMLPQGIEHSNSILHPQGRDHSEFIDKAISVHVEPKYLIPLHIEK